MRINTGKILTRIILVLSCVVNLQQQTSAQNNYIRSWTLKFPTTDPGNLNSGMLPTEAEIMTQYFDGLGRPIQSVQKQLSPQGRDLVSFNLYDPFGRETVKPLPFASSQTPGGNEITNDGLFKSNAINQIGAFYSDANPNTPIKGQGDQNYTYEQIIFESSPLNRITKTLAPGSNWVGANRGIGFGYFTNSLTDAVQIWTVTDVVGGFGSYAITGQYQPGTLFKTITTDENGKQVVEFKDLEGRVILKKVQLSASPDNGNGSGYSGWICTYYIYDDLNQLRCTIQPEGVKMLPSINGDLMNFSNGVLLKEQCFRYEYDARGRIIQKQVPGAAPVYMVYDARDRLVMTQDGNLRSKGKWLVTEYDPLNRPSRSGLLTNGNNHQFHLQAAYTSTAYPDVSASYEVLTQTGYDDYNGLPITGAGNIDLSNYNSTNFNMSFGSSPEYATAVAQSRQINGLSTWSMTKVIGSTANYLYTVNIYDDKARLIQVKSTNITGGIDVSTQQYDFSGKVIRNLVVHQKGGANPDTYKVLTKNQYDHAGRLLSIVKNMKSNASPTMSDKQIVLNTYDELGHLRTKTLGNSLESLTYDYNVRGWLLGANRGYVQDLSSNYFGFDLGYDKNGVLGSYSGLQYNGNIAGTVWKSKGDGAKRKFDFAYDAVNRFMGADFKQLVSGSGSSALFDNSAGLNFTVFGMSYDDNGNIKSMNQGGWKLGGSVPIDLLTYNYFPNSNKLQSVSDAAAPTNNIGDFQDKNTGAVDYGYDVNGNLTTDLNKKLVGSTGLNQTTGGAITYNYLNLPETIAASKDDGSSKGTITYTYDASGVKLQKKTVDVSVSGKTIMTTTTHIAGFVYESQTTIPADPYDYPDRLQFVAHEEGRSRLRTSDNNFQWDYFLKDHLGNVRTVLTEEQQVNAYPAATMEDVANKSNTSDPLNYIPYYVNTDYTANAALRYATSRIVGYPAQSGNNWVARTNGSGPKVGPAIVLKVMAGDKVTIRVNSFWNIPTQAADFSAQSVVTDLVTGLFSLGAFPGAKATTAELAQVNPFQIPVQSFLNNQPQGTDRPKAFFSGMLFDEQFKLVPEFSGSDPIGTAGQLKSHVFNGLVIPKNGFMVLFLSNETQNVDVYWDDFQVTHERGPLLEETQYYPFGLTMAGISSKAAGVLENKKQKFQGQELASKEFSDGSGLEMYEFKWRMDDPQTGRFWQVDPLADKYVYNSPYAFSENKVTVHRELEGLEAEYIFGKAKQELANMFQGAANWIDNTFSAGSKTKVETPITPAAGNSNNTLTVESTTSASTNSSPFMSFVIQNNTSVGYTGDYFKTTTTTTISADKKLSVKTPVASGSLSATTDQDGKTTVSGTGSVKTGSGLNVGVNTSTSSDGTQKVGGSVSIGSGNTTGKTGVTVGTNGKASSVETSIGVEQKVKNTTVTQSFFFKIKW
jgi:Domain of unknown function (DUF6443)